MARSASGIPLSYFPRTLDLATLEFILYVILYINCKFYAHKISILEMLGMKLGVLNFYILCKFFAVCDRVFR